MSSLAVIGATGNIGRAVCASAAARGWTVIELGRPASWAETHLGGVDAIVNCAGVGMDSSLATSGTDLLEANVVTALAAAQLALASGGRLVHFGSSAQLSDHLVQASPYVRSKHLASVALALLAETDGLTGVELLPHIVYGDTLEGSQGVVAAMIRTISAGRPFGLRTPGVRRDFVHRRDVGDAAVAAAEATGRGWEALEIGTGTGHALSEVAEMIGEILGSAEAWRNDSTPGRGWTDDLIADPIPALDRLHFRTEVELRDGLVELVGSTTRGTYV